MTTLTQKNVKSCFGMQIPHEEKAQLDCMHRPPFPHCQKFLENIACFYRKFVRTTCCGSGARVQLREILSFSYCRIFGSLRFVSELQRADWISCYQTEPRLCDQYQIWATHHNAQPKQPCGPSFFFPKLDRLDSHLSLWRSLQFYLHKVCSIFGTPFLGLSHAQSRWGNVSGGAPSKKDDLYLDCNPKLHAIFRYLSVTYVKNSRMHNLKQPRFEGFRK